MIDVKCKACGKRYDYHECGCCPNCGAYNRPPRRQGVTAEGDVYHISDADYQNREKRTKTQGHKVCFEKKVCYKNQAHSTSDYMRPSAFEDDYIDEEDRSTAYEEATDDRFEEAAAAEETRFEEAENRFSYGEDPLTAQKKKKRKAKPDGFQAEEAARKIKESFNKLADHLNILNQNKSCIEKNDIHKEKKSGGKTFAIILAVIGAVNLGAGIIGNFIPAFTDHKESNQWEEHAQMIPEQYTEIYEHMDMLDQSDSKMDCMNVYDVPMGEPFVIDDMVGTMVDYGIESAESIYGWGQLVTVHIRWEDDSCEPILFYEESPSSWMADYYWESEIDSDWDTYQFIINSEDENVHMILVFQNEETEVQVCLQ